MQEPLTMLRSALEGPAPPSGYRWGALYGCLRAIISGPPTQEAVGLLVQVLRSKVALPLDASSEPPHSMSHEEMLKSLAVQALVRWTGLTYLQDMRQVQASAESSVLVGMIEAVIKKAELGKTQLATSPPRTHPEPPRSLPSR